MSERNQRAAAGRPTAAQQQVPVGTQKADSQQERDAEERCQRPVRTARMSVAQRREEVCKTDHQAMEVWETDQQA